MATSETVDYYTYIRSDGWRMKANQAKQRSGYRCQVCNRHASDVQLDAHHRTYERLGNELPEDITVLCHDCHTLYESNRRLPRRSDLTTIFGTVRPSVVPTSQVRPTQTAMTKPSTDRIAPDEYANPGKYMLGRMSALLYVSGVLGNVVWLMSVEAQMVLGNWRQLFNPFFQLQSMYLWVTSALFWQLTVVAVVGMILSLGSVFLVVMFKPRKGALRWYWQMSIAILLKAPFFLLVVFNAIFLFSPLSESIAYTVTQQPTVFEFPLVLPMLNTFVAFLPIPIVHLIWDNSIRSTWGKIATTIVALILIGVLSFGIVGAFVQVING
ncbi:MAG: HNH endonuclease [Caldilinea sp.]|nr:HNH endonuclease [Caldilinea sp.]MCW5844163.1 hypothetical protein [Caldilinea sp.]